MSASQSPRETYLRTLPVRPYCTNQLGSRLHIRDRDEAAGYAIIQHNSPLVWRLMVFDIDGADAYTRAEERRCPPPTFIALNRNNGHGHAAYLLEAPVTAFAKSSRRAMQFYEDVERGLTHKLGADRSYAGFLSKNPLSQRWETDWQAKIPYRLDTLNDYLDESDKRRIKNCEPSGVGRNVATFDAVRLVAYRHWLRFRKAGQSLDAFATFLQDAADAINCTFIPGLHRAEIRGIARSIAKWVWDEFSLERFSGIQSERGKKSWSKTVTLTATKPWEAAGISRAGWYRMQQASATPPRKLLS